jgi:hypothetical protein
MCPTVDDYHCLLSRAVSTLKTGTAEARQKLYERARTAFRAEFGNLSATNLEVLQEDLKLDYAIYDFEWSMIELENRSRHASGTNV